MHARLVDHLSPEAQPAPARILLYAMLPLGDTLFTLPAIAALRACYPYTAISALATPSTTPLLACVPTIDEILPWPGPRAWRHPRRLSALLRTVRERRFDLAIDCTSPAYTWISLLCGVRQTTYPRYDPLWWLVSGAHTAWRRAHAAAHYYGALGALDMPAWEGVSHVPTFTLPAGAREAARRFLRGQGAEAGRPLVALHTGGAWLGGLKRWPAERFAALASRLEREGARILLVGQAEEAALAPVVSAGLRRPPINAAGNLPLLTSLALIEASDLFMGNDSGLLHAAAALGTPYVGIFGPTSLANFAPLSRRPEQGTVVTPPKPCRTPQYFVGGNPIWRRPCCQGICAALATITTERVYVEAHRLLTPHTSVSATG